MQFLDMNPIIDKIRKEIEEKNKGLVILTDNNPDNLSYCHSIIKVNEKEKFLENINIVNIEDRDWQYKVFDLEPEKVYIMNSCASKEYVLEVCGDLEYIGTTIYSEIATEIGISIFPTVDAVIDTIMYWNKNTDLSGKVITIANRSELIGKPLVNSLINLNATINWVHTKTKEAIKLISMLNSDIIVTAAGRPNTFYQCDSLKNQLVVDVGINVVDGRICGDWNMEEVKDYNVTFTPNPGGIGKLTVYELFKQLCMNRIIIDY